MKFKNILLLLISIILIQVIVGCSPQLLNHNIQVQQSGNPSSYSKALVTVLFRVYSDQASIYLPSLEKSIRNGIYNSGYFKEVHLKSESKNQDYDVYFEVTVVPVDSGNTNWWISWPAVYPLVAYWPLQQKEGDAQVSLNVKVTTAENTVEEFSITKKTYYFIGFYSFFNTSPIEDALQTSYYAAIDELSKKIQTMSFGYGEEEIDQGEKVNIAVLDLEAISVTLNEARTLTNKLRGELVRTGRFQVIERSQMEEILVEQGFQQSGLCNTDECYVEAGKLLGVEQLIAGSIGKVGRTYLISIRLIDVSTGVIIKLVDQEIEGSIDQVLKTAIRNVALKISR